MIFALDIAGSENNKQTEIKRREWTLDGRGPTKVRNGCFLSQPLEIRGE